MHAVLRGRVQARHINGSVNIRELKRVAAENGGDSWKQMRCVHPPNGKRVAVIGAGPLALLPHTNYLEKGM